MVLQWSKVTGKHSRFLIVASGPSANDASADLLADAFESGVHIIAINGSILWLPYASDWFTLDPGRVNRPLMKRPRPGVRYFAAVPNDYGTPTAEHITHRRRAEPGIRYLKRAQGAPVAGFVLSEDPEYIRSGNSAFGGLNMAFLMTPKTGSRVALIGVDATRAQYAHGQRGRPGKMWHLPALFMSAFPQLLARKMQVVNGSPYSRVKAFKRTSANKAIKWVMA